MWGLFFDYYCLTTAYAGERLMKESVLAKARTLSFFEDSEPFIVLNMFNVFMFFNLRSISFVNLSPIIIIPLLKE